MEAGYVLTFSDRTFGEFVSEAVDRDIHHEKYKTGGTSKANKLRTFWKIESDYVVGKLILEMVDFEATLNLTPDAEAKARAEKCDTLPLGFSPVVRASARSRNTRRF
jgi:hypothetical protein